MSGPLTRLPSLATTGVGSLPFAAPTEAARHAVTAYQLPFCPQLPHAYGDMVTEWLGADPERCGWAPDRDRQLPAAWDAFVLALTDHPPAHRLVKLQVTGPITLATALEPGARRSRNGTAIVALAREISTWLAATAAEQVAGLRRLGLDTVLVVDEPGLTAVELAAADVSVWDALRGAAGAWGLHICGEVPWPLVDAAEPDLISYDLARYGLGPAAQVTLDRLLSRGGRVAWGALDPLGPHDIGSAARRIAAATAALCTTRTREQALAAALVSGTCGSGLAPVAGEMQLATAIAAVADTVLALPTGNDGTDGDRRLYSALPPASHSSKSCTCVSGHGPSHGMLPCFSARPMASPWATTSE